MRMKRALALLLAMAALWGMLTLPPAAPAASAASASAFNDIYDANVAEAAEILRLLGIVSGTGGSAFQPDRALTRAEFCKMAVELMGNGDQVAAQMNRTVFRDVPSTHWARGYIAVATQGSTSGSGESAVTTPGIIRGDAYGNFNPDRAITYAEAITILVRILGYGDSDVGMVWPNGYLAKADELGLTEGVSLTANDTVTRGQTALLMENLLFADNKEGEAYLTILGCTISDETILFDLNATTPDGASGVKVSQDQIYRTDHVPFSQDLVGRQAKLVLDADEKVIAIQPSEEGTYRVVTIQSLSYDGIRATGGETVAVSDPENTPVWRNGQSSSYEEAYLNGIAAGTQALLQYSSTGTLAYVFLRTSAPEDTSVRVLKNKPNISDDLPYAVYKNGFPASGSDIQQYDVTTFDAASSVMYVSDVKITGIYENVYPNSETPATVTVLGREFPVLATAAADLRTFRVGAQITLLLSYDGQVAGAVDPSVVRGDPVGTVTSISSGTAEVTLLEAKDHTGKDMTLSGAVNYSEERAAEMLGQLVTVSSSSRSRITLRVLSGQSGTAPLNMDTGMMNSVALAGNVRFYEKVGRGSLVPLEREDITRTVIPAEEIAYVHRDYSGRADIVIFDGATGDGYTYGMVQTTSEVDAQTGRILTYATVTNIHGASQRLLLSSGENLRGGSYGGLAVGPTRSDGTTMLEGWVELQSASVPSSAFDVEAMTVTTPGMVLPIARNVMCYNQSTGAWYQVAEDAGEEAYVNALNLARAFSDHVTIYYDRTPDEGGKVRIVVVS